MGISCTLSPIGTFTYRAELGEGLIEHELVHVVETAVIMNHTIGFDTHLPHTITPVAVGIDGKHMYPIEQSDLM